MVPQYNQWFITLAAADLVAGHNSVIVSYERAHSTDGEGLHRYKDATDGKVYLYSHFEPAAAHQMFALFDQPDLKATFRLTVSAPKDWQVISTRRETAIEDRGATRRWTFPATPVLSPYNFSLHAGPYHVWEDNTGKYPMRLFARQSVASQVSPKDWFRYTSRGLEYFDSYFGIPYPFAKYDQVLVPQFIYGAMENAAAVTFTESRFLSPSVMTASDRENLSSTILHEMAHQWFGDLVTMKWWNGLWLNESFASYMEKLASAESEEFGDPALQMYRGKRGAYRTDQSITTHPIEVPVASTANAFDNIDSITYSKGASVLHQLRQSIGAETFRQGVNDYLTRHAYGNATLDDFIGALSKASGRDLKPWAQEWLYQPGVNSLRAEFDCADGKLSRLQPAAIAGQPGLPDPAHAAGAGGLVQPDRRQAGAGRQGGRDLFRRQHRRALTGRPGVSGPGLSELRGLGLRPGRPGSEVVRHGRRASGQRRGRPVAFDVVAGTGRRPARWPARPRGLHRDGVAQYAAGSRITPCSDKRWAMCPPPRATCRYSPKAHAYEQRTTERMERMLWSGLQASRADNDRARRWLGTYIEVASSKGALANLDGMLAGKVDAGGVEIDQDIRWEIIGRLNRVDAPGSAALVTAEIARDKSESGQLAALRSTVGRPDAALKLKWLATIQALDGAEPYSRLRIAMSGLYPSRPGGAERAHRRTAFADAARFRQGGRSTVHPQLRRQPDPGHLHPGQRRPPGGRHPDHDDCLGQHSPRPALAP